MCCCKTMVKITRGVHWADLRTLLCHTSFMKFVSELRGLVWYRKSASVGSEYIICCSPCRCSMVYGNKWTLNTPTHSQIICKRQVQIPFISNAPYHLYIRHPLLLVFTLAICLFWSMWQLRRAKVEMKFAKRDEK